MSLPGYETGQWFGIGVPRGTPIEIVETLKQEVGVSLGDPKMIARVTGLGGSVLALSSVELGRLIAEETERWGKVIRIANIKPA